MPHTALMKQFKLLPLRISLGQFRCVLIIQEELQSYLKLQNIQRFHSISYPCPPAYVPNSCAFMILNTSLLGSWCLEPR